MQKKMQEIASVLSGYSFRGSVEAEPTGDLFVVQAKNLIANKNIIDITNLTPILSQGIRNPNFLQHNDVLLVSRSSGFGTIRSSIFASDEKNIIVSSSLIIIRVKDITVLPKYISLYLNSLEGQKSLMQIVTGSSYIQSILVKNLQELIIPVPPMHTQKSIIALQENISEQEKLLERKNEIQQNIVNASFANLINK